MSTWISCFRAPRLFGALLTACTLVAALCYSGVAQAEQPKIAVINLSRAVADTEDGIRAKAALQELFDARQVEFEGKEKAVAAAKADLERLTKEGKTKETELRKKYAALEKMAIELQAMQYNYSREMERERYKKMQPIAQRVLVLVRRLAAQNGYDMVLNSEYSATGLPATVAYHRSDLDITDRIVQSYNAAATPAAPPAKGKGKGKRKPKAPAKKPAPKPAPAKAPKAPRK